MSSWRQNPQPPSTSRGNSLNSTGTATVGSRNGPVLLPVAEVTVVKPPGPATRGTSNSSATGAPTTNSTTPGSPFTPVAPSSNGHGNNNVFADHDFMSNYNEEEALRQAQELSLMEQLPWDPQNHLVDTTMKVREIEQIVNSAGMGDYGGLGGGGNAWGLGGAGHGLGGAGGDSNFLGTQITDRELSHFMGNYEHEDSVSLHSYTSNGGYNSSSVGGGALTSRGGSIGGFGGGAGEGRGNNSYEHPFRAREKIIKEKLDEVRRNLLWYQDKIEREMATTEDEGNFEPLFNLHERVMNLVEKTAAPPLLSRGGSTHNTQALGTALTPVEEDDFEYLPAPAPASRQTSSTLPVPPAAARGVSTSSTITAVAVPSAGGASSRMVSEAPTIRAPSVAGTSRSIIHIANAVAVNPKDESMSSSIVSALYTIRRGAAPRAETLAAVETLERLGNLGGDISVAAVKQMNAGGALNILLSALSRATDNNWPDVEYQVSKVVSVLVGVEEDRSLLLRNAGIIIESLYTLQLKSQTRGGSNYGVPPRRTPSLTQLQIEDVPQLTLRGESPVPPSVSDSDGIRSLISAAIAKLSLVLTAEWGKMEAPFDAGGREGGDQRRNSYGGRTLSHTTQRRGLPSQQEPNPNGDPKVLLQALLNVITMVCEPSLNNPMYITSEGNLQISNPTSGSAHRLLALPSPLPMHSSSANAPSGRDRSFSQDSSLTLAYREVKDRNNRVLAGSAVDDFLTFMFNVRLSELLAGTISKSHSYSIDRSAGLGSFALVNLAEVPQCRPALVSHGALTMIRNWLEIGIVVFENIKAICSEHLKIVENHSHFQECFFQLFGQAYDLISNAAAALMLLCGGSDSIYTANSYGDHAGYSVGWVDAQILAEGLPETMVRLISAAHEPFASIELISTPTISVMPATISMHLAQALFQLYSREQNRPALVGSSIPYALCMIFESSVNQYEMILNDYQSPENDNMPPSEEFYTLFRRIFETKSAHQSAAAANKRRAKASALIEIPKETPPPLTNSTSSRTTLQHDKSWDFSTSPAGVIFDNFANFVDNITSSRASSHHNMADLTGLGDIYEAPISPFSPGSGNGGGNNNSGTKRNGSTKGAPTPLSLTNPSSSRNGRNERLVSEELKDMMAVIIFSCLDTLNLYLDGEVAKGGAALKMRPSATAAGSATIPSVSGPVLIQMLCNYRLLHGIATATSNLPSGVARLSVIRILWTLSGIPSALESLYTAGFVAGLATLCLNEQENVNNISGRVTGQPSPSHANPGANHPSNASSNHPSGKPPPSTPHRGSGTATTNVGGKDNDRVAPPKPNSAKRDTSASTAGSAHGKTGRPHRTYSGSAMSGRFSPHHPLQRQTSDESSHGTPSVYSLRLEEDDEAYMMAEIAYEETYLICQTIANLCEGSTEFAKRLCIDGQVGIMTKLTRSMHTEIIRSALRSLTAMAKVVTHPIDDRQSPGCTSPAKNSFENSQTINELVDSLTEIILSGPDTYNHLYEVVQIDAIATLAQLVYVKDDIKDKVVAVCLRSVLNKFLNPDSSREFRAAVEELLRGIGFQSGRRDYETCGYDANIMTDWYAMTRALKPQELALDLLRIWLFRLLLDDASYSNEFALSAVDAHMYQFDLLDETARILGIPADQVERTLVPVYWRKNAQILQPSLITQTVLKRSFTDTIPQLIGKLFGVCKPEEDNHSSIGHFFPSSNNSTHRDAGVITSQHMNRSVSGSAYSGVHGHDGVVGVGNPPHSPTHKEAKELKETYNWIDRPPQRSQHLLDLYYTSKLHQLLLMDLTSLGVCLPMSVGENELMRNGSAGSSERDDLAAFLVPSPHDIRAVLLPSREYQSFNRVGRVLQKMFEYQHTDHGSNLWALTFRDSEFQGEFHETLLSTLQQCPQICSLTFSHHRVIETEALLGHLIGDIPSTVRFVSFKSTLAKDSVSALCVKLRNQNAAFIAPVDYEENIRHATASRRGYGQPKNEKTEASYVTARQQMSKGILGLALTYLDLEEAQLKEIIKLLHPIEESTKTNTSAAQSSKPSLKGRNPSTPSSERPPRIPGTGGSRKGEITPSSGSSSKPVTSPSSSRHNGLPESIASLRGLRYLDLSHNHLHDHHCAQILAAALGGPLEGLELGGNMICKGVEFLKVMDELSHPEHYLGITHRLRYLGLSQNDIPNHTVMDMLHKLKSNTTLTSLDLAGNLIEGNQKMHDALNDFLEKNKGLRVLDLSHNRLTTQSFGSLYLSILKNKTLLMMPLVGNPGVEIEFVKNVQMIQDELKKHRISYRKSSKGFTDGFAVEDGTFPLEDLEYRLSVHDMRASASHDTLHPYNTSRDSEDEQGSARHSENEIIPMATATVVELQPGEAHVEYDDEHNVSEQMDPITLKMNEETLRLSISEASEGTVDQDGKPVVNNSRRPSRSDSASPGTSALSSPKKRNSATSDFLREALVAVPVEPPRSVPKPRLNKSNSGTRNLFAPTNGSNDSTPSNATSGTEVVVPPPTSLLPPSIPTAEHADLKSDPKFVSIYTNTLHVLFSAPLVGYERVSRRAIAMEVLDYAAERDMLCQVFKEVHRDVGIHFDFATTHSLRTLLSLGYRTLHFSGHGVQKSLCFEDGRSGLHIVSVDELKNLITAGGLALDFVFVSACYSKDVGEAFVAAGVKHVVCVKVDSKIQDSAAIAFTRAFYIAILSGNSVRHSFDIAKEALKLSPYVKDSVLEGEKFILLPETTSNHHDHALFPHRPHCEWPQKRQCTIGANETDVRAFLQKFRLPSPPADFEGRETEMNQLIRYFVEGRRFVSLCGDDGLGKSAVAAAACRYMADREMFDAIVYFKCKGCKTFPMFIQNLLQAIKKCGANQIAKNAEERLKARVAVHAAATAQANHNSHQLSHSSMSANMSLGGDTSNAMDVVQGVVQGVSVGLGGLDSANILQGTVISHGGLGGGGLGSGLGSGLGGGSLGGGLGGHGGLGGGLGGLGGLGNGQGNISRRSIVESSNLQEEEEIIFQCLEQHKVLVVLDHLDDLLPETGSDAVTDMGLFLSKLFEQCAEVKVMNVSTNTMRLCQVNVANVIEMSVNLGPLELRAALRLYAKLAHSLTTGQDKSDFIELVLKSSTVLSTMIMEELGNGHPAKIVHNASTSDALRIDAIRFRCLGQMDNYNAVQQEIEQRKRQQTQLQSSHQQARNGGLSRANSHTLSLPTSAQSQQQQTMSNSAQSVVSGTVPGNSTGVGSSVSGNNTIGSDGQTHAHVQSMLLRGTDTHGSSVGSISSSHTQLVLQGGNSGSTSLGLHRGTSIGSRFGSAFASPNSPSSPSQSQQLR